MKIKSKVKSQRSKVSERGFTLVELLTSIIALVAVGAVVAGIVTSSFRGANKTTTIETIRQNGNYILAQMSKNIQYAQVFSGVSVDGDESAYTTSCLLSLSPTPMPVYEFIKVKPLDLDEVTYNCSSDPILTITTGGVTTSLVDDSVELKNCSLTCAQNKSADVPIVGISFTLAPKNSNGLLENSTPPISFETSVTIRNYKK